MARFERQATESGDLPALLGSATEEFRRSLERHVQQIVEVAQGHAAEIERDADRKAKQKQQQADLRAGEAVQGVITRAKSVLDSIELVQTAISGMLSDLRTEVKNLEAGAATGAIAAPAAKPQAPDQRLAKKPPDLAAQPGRQATPPAPPAPPERKEAPRPSAAQPAAKPPTREVPAPPTPPAEQRQPAATDTRPKVQEQTSKAPPAPKQQPATAAGPAAQSRPAEARPATEVRPPTEARPDSDAERPAEPLKQKTQPDQNADSSAEFDQMIHGEIRRMFEGGKPREDVERFLERLELGDNYAGLLDELYSQGAPGRRRRLFGRRRDR